MAKIYVLPYYRKGLSNSITSSGQLKRHRATLKVNLGVELNKKIDDTPVDKLLDGQEIQLMGPADVKSVQKKAISRISPPEASKAIYLILNFSKKTCHGDIHRWPRLMRISDLG